MIRPDQENTLRSARKQAQHRAETSVEYWAGQPSVYQNSAARRA